MILDGIKKRGVKDSKVVVSNSRSVSVVYREGRPDRVEESSRRSVSVSLYEDAKYSSSSSNDLRPDALETFLDNAVAMTRAMVPDPFREITDPALYAERQDIDLQLYDPAVENISDARRKELASSSEAAALEASGDSAISAESGVETSVGSSLRMHSNGFAGEVKGTQMWIFTEISLKDQGDKRPSGWDLDWGRFVTDLGDPEAVGTGAVERARLKLGTRKVATQKCPMIVENRTVDGLLGGLMGATNGRSLQQKQSFLAELEGKPVGADIFTITDDPFVLKGFNSRLFDSEGISARKMIVFEKGIFKTFFIDTYYGKKMNRPPTTGDRSNLIIAPGTQSLNALVGSLDKGILVRGFIGGNTNRTTGDFSLGVHGTLIENGKPTDAVSELNISGNHKEIWHRLKAVGNDPWKFGSSVSPSLLFDEIQFSGS